MSSYDPPPEDEQHAGFGQPEDEGFGQPDEPGPDGELQRPRKRKMPGAIKFLLIFATLGMVLSCGCCGFLFYHLQQQAESLQQMTQNPERGKVLFRKAIGAEPPPEMFEHVGVGQAKFFGIMEFEIVIMDTTAADGMVGLVMLSSDMFPGGEEMERELRKQKANMGDELKVEKSEERVVTIRDQQVQLTFVQGISRNNSKRYRQIHGLIPINGGLAMLIYQIDAEAYDEQSVLQWLQSGNTQPVEAAQ